MPRFFVLTMGSTLYWQEESLKTCFGYFYRSYSSNPQLVIAAINTYTNCGLLPTTSPEIGILTALLRGQIGITDETVSEIQPELPYINNDVNYRDAILKQVIKNLNPRNSLECGLPEAQSLIIINTINRQEVWGRLAIEDPDWILIPRDLSCMPYMPTMPMEICSPRVNIDESRLYMGSPDGVTEGFWIEFLGNPPGIRTHLRVQYMHTYGYVLKGPNFHYKCDGDNGEVIGDLVPAINQNGEIMICPRFLDKYN